MIHLHVHSDASTNDSVLKAEDAVKWCAAQGYGAISVTDHGTMGGTMEFYKAAKKHGVQPILGQEFYVVDDNTKKEKGYNHITVLAKNNRGWRNMLELQRNGEEGFYFKPRITWDQLKSKSDLIILSGCFDGYASQAFLRNDYEAAKKWAKGMKQAFGPDFFFEAQYHGMKEQEMMVRNFERLSKELGIRICPTNDAHYLTSDEASVRNALFALQGRGHTSGDQMYLKRTEEMPEMLQPYIPTTYDVAFECEVEFEKKLHLPKYPVPNGANKEEFFLDLCAQGMHRIGKFDDPTYQARLALEVNVLLKAGFADYMLVAWDYVKAAKEKGIEVGLGRGSGAGCLVTYLLGITGVDPIKYGLIFERFLSIEQPSLPDLDIDFQKDRREEVIDYVREKYGKDHVVRMGAYGSKNPRGALKLAVQVTEGDDGFKEANRISAMIPYGCDDMEVALAIPEVVEFLERKGILEMFKTFCGLKAAQSIHPAGVIISDVPFYEELPVHLDKNDEWCTDWDMYDLDETGFVKFDFLGLSTLTLMKNTGLDPKIWHDAKDNPVDAKVFGLMRSGRFPEGLFQIEGSEGITKLAKDMHIETIEDVCACVALYRPPVLRAKMDKMFVEHKATGKRVFTGPKIFVQILEPTYGTVVYQEQVMQTCRDVGGFTPGQVDKVKKAIKYKDPSIFLQLLPLFREGAAKLHGLTVEQSDGIFKFMAAFASYGFNKAHSMAYGMLSYQTAYLKTYHPLEFFRALLATKAHEDFGKIANEAKLLGIKILPPSVNESWDHEVVEIADHVKKNGYDDSGKYAGSIRFGWGYLKGVGVATAKKIETEYWENGPFTGRLNFKARMGSKANKKIQEIMEAAGCFDCFPDEERFPYDENDPKFTKEELFGWSDDALPPELAEQIAKGKAFVLGFNEGMVPAYTQGVVIGKVSTKKPFKKETSRGSKYGKIKVMIDGVELWCSAFDDETAFDGYKQNQYIAMMGKITQYGFNVEKHLPWHEYLEKISSRK